MYMLIWLAFDRSIGVITYILLCGYPPFSDERRELLVRRIKAGSYAFHEQYWSAVSNEAKDFIRKLLVIDPAKRLTVDQALQDPWVSDGLQHVECDCVSTIIV